MIKPMESRDIYWGVENREDGYYLHAFTTLDSRGHWLYETEGIIVASPGGRGLPMDLIPACNPLRNAYTHPIIWH